MATGCRSCSCGERAGQDARFGDLAIVPAGGGWSCESTAVPAGGHRGEGHSHVPAGGIPGCEW
eukprot:scaffold8683_cov104-Isochrysis_galbana.AAC.4